MLVTRFESSEECSYVRSNLFSLYMVLKREKWLKCAC
nr:MAG TPA: hypothetical protein [Caudoviricetes sp.]